MSTRIRTAVASAVAAPVLFVAGCADASSDVAASGPGPSEPSTGDTTPIEDWLHCGDRVGGDGQADVDADGTMDVEVEVLDGSRPDQLVLRVTNDSDQTIDVSSEPGLRLVDPDTQRVVAIGWSTAQVPWYTEVPSGESVEVTGLHVPGPPSPFSRCGQSDASGDPDSHDDFMRFSDQDLVADVVIVTSTGSRVAVASPVFHADGSTS